MAIKIIKSKLFLKAYLASFFVIILVIFSVYMIHNNYDNETSIDDFLVDTDYIYSISKRLLREDPDGWSAFSRVLEFYFHQSVQIMKIEESKKLVFDSDFNKKKGNITIVYYESTGVLKAIYPLSSSHNMVIGDITVQDVHASMHESFDRRANRELKRERFEAFVFLLAIVLVMLVVAFALIYMLKKISQYFNIMAEVGRSFSSGSYDARMPKNFPKPLDRLSFAFNKMASELENIMVEKEVFFGAISHELRTPLTKIKLANDIAVKKDPDNVLLHDMSRYINEIEYLSENIILLSKVGSCNFKADYVDIKRLIKDRCEFYEDVFFDKKIEIEEGLDKDLYVNKSGFLIQLLVDNIIKNSLYYAKSKVHVCYCLKEKYISISVDDDGPGIPFEKRKDVFIPFLRLDSSRNREAGGYGLGLAIAQKAAQRLEGEIAVSDSKLGGARFLIELLYK